MKVIFLDVDGVLIHNESLDGVNLHIDEENVKVLKEIVDKTDAKIVLSSAWRKEYNKDLPGKKNRYKVLENILNRNALQIYDRTPIIKEQSLPYEHQEDLQVINLSYDPKTTRAAEINSYIENHEEIESFLILDDENHEWEYFGFENNWIHTDPSKGALQKHHIPQAIEILEVIKTKRR